MNSAFHSRNRQGLPAPVEAWSDVKAKFRAEEIGRTVEINRRAVINGGRIPIHRSAVRRVGRLVHVKVDSLRNAVLRGEHVAGPKPAGLDKLVRGERKSLDHVIVRT